MKNLIIAFTVFLAGCGCNYTPVATVPIGNQYEYIQDPMAGTTMVRVYDGGISYMVDLMTFNSLGYGGCINYYHSHRGCYPAYNVNVYRSWRNTGRVVPSYRPSAPGYRPSGSSVRPSVSPSYRPSGGTVRPAAPAYRPSYTPSSRPSYSPSRSSSSSRPSYRRS